jgi:hypothetical protein
MKNSYHHFVDRQHPDDYRQKEIRALTRAIRAKENRLVLGIPDIGLSNLLRFLVTRGDWGERNVVFAYLDCDALEDCLDPKIFFAEIAHQFHEQRSGSRLCTDVQGYEQLRRFLLEAGGDRLDRLVVVANKTEKMLEAADAAFYRKLKGLTDLNKRLCYIFAASPRISNLVDSEGLLFAGRRLIVGPFNGRDLIGAIAEEGQRLETEFGPAEQEQLSRLTGGHAGLLRAIASAVVDEELDLSNPEARLAERLLARGDVESRCQRIWRELDPAKQSALYAIVSSQPRRVPPEALSWLRALGIVCKRNSEYELFSQVFAGFVLAQQVSPLPLESVTIVGASTIFANEQEIAVAGKVLKGNEEVYVTPLELRLIACLKREPRIYTKDEITKYVYYQEKGDVEDQRIEDLVRRVRNRLGDQYVKTHWGKGYELVG